MQTVNVALMLDMNFQEESRVSFFERVTDDMEIARVILLLTGSIQGTKKQVLEYLQSFTKYDWLWKHNADSLYMEFMKTNPELDDYDREVRARAHVRLRCQRWMESVHDRDASCLSLAVPFYP